MPSTRRGAGIHRAFRSLPPVGLSFATSVVIQGLNVVTGVLLARDLGPAGRGELAAAILWPTVLAAVGSLGLMEAITYHAARAEPAATIAGSSLAAAAVQSATAIALGAVVLPIVLSRHDHATVTTALLYLAYVPLNMVTLYAVGLLNGLQRYGSAQTIRLVVISGSVAGLVAVAATVGLTVRRAVLVYLVSNLVTTLTALALTWRAGVRELGFSPRTTRDLLAFGLKSHTGNMSSLLNERLDQLVISIFLAPAKLGLYVVAVTLTSLTSIVGASVSLVALPRIAAASREAAREAARRYVALTLCGAAVLTAPVLLAAPAAIGLFFGDEFRGAAGPARVLLVAAVVLTTNRVLASVLQAAGRPLDAGIAELIGLTVTAVALAALLPTAGLMGAALASLIAYAATLVWSARRAAAALELPVLRLFTRGSTA